MAKQATPSQEGLDQLLEATKGLGVALAAVQADYPSEDRQAFTRLNAYLRAYSAWLKALEDLGHVEAAAQFRASICTSMTGSMSRVPRSVSIGERRALVAAQLYRAGYRLPFSDKKKQPMIAAMLATDLFIDTADEAGEYATPDEWQAAFLKNYDRFVASFDMSEEDVREKVHNKVRKDIARFKKRVAAAPLYQFDAQKLQFVEVSFAESAHGLKRDPGRPRESED
jgi:hypothetical protein